jgi:hypothetical protein
MGSWESWSGSNTRRERSAKGGGKWILELRGIGGGRMGVFLVGPESYSLGAYMAEGWSDAETLADNIITREER